MEHRDLKLSQLTREVINVHGKLLVAYKYTEYVSKNHCGGLKQLKQENKVVRQFESEDVHRCHVILLDKYLSKLPEEAKNKDLFYLKPRSVKPHDPCAPWYTSVPLGKNKLSEMMKTIAKEGKLDESYTNHSLRAYGVTKLFKANIPEKIIMERSGHTSLKGLRKYERTDALQELQVCNTLVSRKKPDTTVSTLPKPPVTQPFSQPLIVPNFSGTFNNCVIQIAPPVPQLQQAPLEDFSNIDLKELLEF